MQWVGTDEHPSGLGTEGRQLPLLLQTIKHYSGPHGKQCSPTQTSCLEF